MTDYTPIDCSKHSEYELIILQGKRMRISWRDSRGDIHIAALLPMDLLTRNHEEFLLARDDRQHLCELRLDYLLKIEAL